MAGLRRFLSKRLRLQVNEGKSAVDLVSRRGFLGFSFWRRSGRVKIRFDPESLRRVTDAARRP